MKSIQKSLFRAVMLALCWLAAVPMVLCASYRFDLNYDAWTTFESSRKDYRVLEIPAIGSEPRMIEREYDKSFIGSVHDLYLAFEKNFGDWHFLDIRENLHFKTFRPEEFRSFSGNTMQYRMVDHRLDVVYGAMIGDDDLFKLNLRHAVNQIPDNNVWDFNSYGVTGKLYHLVKTDQTLSIDVRYDERRYANFETDNFNEGAAGIEYSVFIPRRIHHRLISASARGDRAMFERVPTGLATRKAVDYYTSYTKKPGDEYGAKYVSNLAQGDWWLNLRGEVLARRLTSFSNGFSQPRITLSTTYHFSRFGRVYLEDTYYQRDYKNESDRFALYDHYSNRFLISSLHEPEGNFIYQFAFSNKIVGHPRRRENDFSINQLSFETRYERDATFASVHLRGKRHKYDLSRQLYSTNDEIRAIAAYDYFLTPSTILNFKNEWVDARYNEQDETLLYSSFVRTTWQVGVEKLLSESQSVEVGYQYSNEKHKIFSDNNQTEKNLFFNWYSNF